MIQCWGVDDGSRHIGVALVQKCDTKNKCVFKGTIEQRQDVKKLMADRAAYRRLCRSNKRYRPTRFDNRSNSKRNGRLPPSILQKKQAVTRFVNKINKWVNIGRIVFEDVAIDIRVLTEGSNEVCGFRHGDYVKYIDKNGIKWFGYITAMYHDKLQINVQCSTKHLKRVNARKSIFVCRCPQISII